jgi:GNAT superfamily N-acetyltransferase
VARVCLLERDLLRNEPQDPRLLLLRKQTRTDLIEDYATDGWWEAQAIGVFRPTQYRLTSRADETELARATTWEIASGAGLGDGRPRTGLINVFVHPDHRRKGHAQLLIQEIGRHARDQGAEILAVQTDESNAPARALYDRLGFTPVDTATLYRRPG